MVGPISTKSLDQLDCSYRNGSDRMVIVRCCGPAEFFLERVVFPFELLTFSCPPDSEVKIWTHGLGGPELIESLTAEQLSQAHSQPTPIHSEQPLPTPWMLVG